VSFATLSGVRVTKACVVLPCWGIWTADVAVDDPSAITGQVDLVLGGLTLTGTVYRGGAYQGAGAYRMVGGADGWRIEVPTRAYQNGARLSSVLGDAARACGETVEVDTDRTVGPFYVRPLGPASRALQTFAPRGWYVDVDGVTRLAARDGSAVGSTYDVTGWAPDKGRATLATETPADMMPGRVVTVAPGVLLTVGSAVLQLAETGLRVELWGAVS
jgi:hypothetical protein